MANDENLKPPWKKGESGNVEGRPKGARNRSTIAKEILGLELRLPDPMQLLNIKELQEQADEQGVELSELIKIEGTAEQFMTLAQLFKAIQKGDTNAYKALLDSAYGTPKQTIDHNTTETLPPQIVFTDKNKKSDEEE